MKTTVALILSLLTSWAQASVTRCELPQNFNPKVRGRLDLEITRLYVQKENKKLFVFSGDAVLNSYRISLGPKWDKGPKRFMGDKKTPGGRYYLDQLNWQSGYHLALHISYPDADDNRFADQNERDPGGDIMLHGFATDETLDRRPDIDLSKHTTTRDWTDGCVAVTDAEIDEIFGAIARQYRTKKLLNSDGEVRNPDDTDSLIPIDLCP